MTLNKSRYRFISNSFCPFHFGITRKDFEQKLGNKEIIINEKENNETSDRNPRTCSEAVGMEKLIPSLRQRQHIGNPINIHHAKNRLIQFFV